MCSTVIWTDHDSLFLQGLRHFYINGEYTDLTIRCNDKEFQVHKLVLRLFTDYFDDLDGLWVRINVASVFLEKLLCFIYFGEVNVGYHEMEEFLSTCKQLRIKLFKNTDMPELSAEIDRMDEVYELNDFQLMCKACYRVFNDDKCLKKHIAQSCKVKNHSCNMCDKKFANKTDLENHERVHTGEKPFQCDECERAFRSKFQLRAHANFLHKGINFPCEQCEKIFANRTLLKHHTLSKHEQIKPHECHHCGARFALKSVLKTHLALKHKIKSNFRRTKVPKLNANNENMEVLEDNPEHQKD